MKSHAELNEKWLQGILAKDPTLLGLGDLEVKDIERRQPGAGRLDMLLTDPEEQIRYEVEIQLGATDETHIIRTIEYWDLERNRYPMYDHVAVIVAEDVTSRFLNVISLLHRAVPLIAIQINAWEVETGFALIATKVLDLAPVAPDDESDAPGQSVNRQYWTTKSSPEGIKVVDSMLTLVNEATGDPNLALKYNRYYIGLSRDGLPDNFVIMRPRKLGGHVLTQLKVLRNEELTDQIVAAGLNMIDYDTKTATYRLRLTQADLTKNRPILTEIIQRASGLKSATSEINVPPATVPSEQQNFD